MAYKKQLRDKDGNVIYPDVGLNLDDVVYSDDPVEGIDNIIDPNSYSTEEKWTSGYWIDGRKIYKKTMNFGALPNATSKSKSFGISNLGMFIQITGIAVYPNGVAMALPFSGVSSLEASVAVNADGDSMVITTGTNRSSATGYITAYYVKSSE